MYFRLRISTTSVALEISHLVMVVRYQTRCPMSCLYGRENARAFDEVDKWRVLAVSEFCCKEQEIQLKDLSLRQAIRFIDASTTST
jgi:hypothetical protein